MSRLAPSWIAGADEIPVGTVRIAGAQNILIGAVWIACADDIPGSAIWIAGADDIPCGAIWIAGRSRMSRAAPSGSRAPRISRLATVFRIAGKRLSC